jgi:hypothetical protein
MSDAAATIVVAFIGFISGLVVTRYTFRQKADELFLSSLQHLAGGTHERNVGITALELAWESRRLRKHIAPLLVGSAVYLLLESKQDDAVHEVYNLQRLVKLLVAAKSSGSLGSEDEQALLQAIDKKLFAGADKPPGLLLADSALRTWQNQLKKTANPSFKWTAFGVR